jgi:hypothetical protein
LPTTFLTPFPKRSFGLKIRRLPTISDNERWNLFPAIPRIWDTYYPLGEAEDVAENLGDLLLVLDFYQAVLLY